MKIFLGPNRGQPIDRARATNCAVINLAATPGLGSWLAGRVLEGVGQLILAVTGFCLIIGWFAQLVMLAVKRFGGAAPEGQTSFGLLKVGGVIFVASWLWSLVTSLSVWREAKRNAAANARRQPPA